MTVEIEQLHPLFVGEVHGINISRPLDAVTVETLQAAIDRYAVLVFRGQRLEDEQQVDFARYFGEPERSALSYGKNAKLRLKKPEMADVSNLDPDTGQPQRGEARLRMINLGNRLWHTDSSFRLPCGALSMLYAHATPPSGGETEFADLRAAYDALPEAKQAEIEDLMAEHSLMHSRALLGFTGFTQEERDALPPVHQPLVRLHPRTGRKSLYLASHASHVLGLPVPEGRLLLMELTEHATQRAFVYRHTWRVGDLMLWDNRCTLHRGMPFDETYARDMRRVTTQDAPALAADHPAGNRDHRAQRLG